MHVKYFESYESQYQQKLSSLIENSEKLILNVRDKRSFSCKSLGVLLHFIQLRWKLDDIFFFIIYLIFYVLF